MIIVDTALKAREAEGRPIRVASIGAGFMGHGLTNQIVNSVPGMRMVAAYNRRAQRANRYVCLRRAGRCRPGRDPGRG